MDIPENVRALGDEMVEIWTKDQERIAQRFCHKRVYNWGFSCTRCKESHTLLELFELPKCWQSIQRRNKRLYEKAFDGLPASLRRAYSRAFQHDCADCGKPIYWEGGWPAKEFRCPRCYKANRLKERNYLARMRYREKKHGRLDPTCKQCGEKFKAVRCDAKFCSARCRVAAHRVEHAK